MPIFTFMLTRQLIKFNYSNVAGGGQLLSRGLPRGPADSHSPDAVGICINHLNMLTFLSAMCGAGGAARNGQDPDKTRH